MQERRVRLGDILDDYCPRERRVTNHAVVAMIEDDVKQTRCTTCDSDHEYKHARVPPQRKRKTAAALAGLPTDPVVVGRAEDAAALPEAEVLAGQVEDADPAVAEDETETEPVEQPVQADDDDWPVHRRLIRATLPRPEGQTPERREPDFTIRQNDGRPNGQRNNGNRRRRNRQQTWQGLQGLPSGPFTHGSSRSGPGQGFQRGAGQHGGNSQRQGNRQDSGSQQGGRQGQGQGGGGQRPGRRGRKRGR